MTLLNDLYAKATELGMELDEVTDDIDRESTRLARTVSMDIRKASYLLTSEDGRNIVVGRSKNTYGEVKIWAHDGKKKGVLIKEGVRESIRRIKIQLANGDFK